MGGRFFKTSRGVLVPVAIGLGVGATLFALVLLIQQSGIVWSADLSSSSSMETSSGFLLAVAAPILAMMVGTVAFSRVSRSSDLRSTVALKKAETALQDVKDPDDLIGLIKANASQMESYDAMARTQATQSHLASLIAMFIGLALVAAGVMVAVFAPDTVSKITGSSLSAVGAVVGGYISRTFLLNGRQASENAVYYFQQPLVTSYLLTAERLLAQLPDSERHQALSATINTVLRQVSALSHGSENSPADQPR